MKRLVILVALIATPVSAQSLDGFDADLAKYVFYAEHAGRCNVTMEISGARYIRDSADCMTVFNNQPEIARLTRRVLDYYDAVIERKGTLSAREKSKISGTVRDIARASDSLSEFRRRAKFLSEHAAAK